MLRNQLVAIMSGAVFLFIGLASCCLAAVRRREGMRIFVWLGIWSGLWGARLLAESAAVVAALPHWVQISVPFLRIAVTYLLLPLASLAWLELSTGKFRHFLRALVFISLAIGVAGIAVFVITGSGDKLLPYNNLLAATALIVLVIVVAVPALSRKFLALPNRAVMVVGTLAFAVWNVINSLYDLENSGASGAGIVARGGKIITALIYGGVGGIAFSLLFAGGRRGDDSSIANWTGAVMGWPGGRWLVGLVGLIVAGAGVFLVVNGWKEKYQEHLQANRFTQNWNWLLKAGVIAHGVVTTLIGMLFLQAAWRANPDKAGGIGRRSPGWSISLMAKFWSRRFVLAGSFPRCPVATSKPSQRA